MNFLNKYNWKFYFFLIIYTSMITLLNEFNFLGIRYWGIILAISTIMVLVIIKAIAVFTKKDVNW